VVNYNGEPEDETPVWFKLMESDPLQKESESPEAPSGSGNEADARKPHGDLLRAKIDPPAEDKTQRMKQGDQPEDDPRDEEECLLMCHWDYPMLRVWATGSA